MPGHSILFFADCVNLSASPGIHIFLAAEGVDGRDKPGHDGERETSPMTSSPFDLTGKVAIVTGGNGGIGLGMARGLAAAGAAIAIVGRDEAKSNAAVTELSQSGAKAISVLADVTGEAAVTAMVEHVRRELGRVDILVSNAGINIRKPPDALSLAEWDSVIDTNLTSAFLCSRAVHPAMKAAGGGKIINIGSMMSIFGASFAPAYAASKGGIVQFTRSCAVAWAIDKIQINAVLPGWIDTDLTRRAREEVAGLHDKVLARTPAARWGASADFAGIAVFLSSAASDFVTGTAIPVDGGFSIMG
jgi:2-dehydro-3-deoxy-D-gluconate 5-dehydrogenase